MEDQSTAGQPAFNAPYVEWAVYYASKGIPVFPVAHNAKEPAIKGGRGCLDATTDEAQIRAWWKKEPGANIGGATGYLFDVIDVDEGQVGRDTIGKYEKGISHIPTIVKTVKGGFHLYYSPCSIPLANRAKPRGLPGLDVRTKGGYVLLPPSYAVDGEFAGSYEWWNGRELNGSVLPEFPEWAIPFFRRDGRLTNQADITSIFNGDLEDGKKHDQLRDAIYKMRMGGFDIEVTKAVIESCISKIDPKRFKKTASQVLESCYRDINHVYTTKEANPRYSWSEGNEAALDEDFRDTELGHAERFALTYGDQIRYVPERDQWLLCEHDVWRPQPGGDNAATYKAGQFARVLSDEYTAKGNSCLEAANDPDCDTKALVTLSKQAEALHKKATNMEKAATIGNIIKLAKPNPAINTNLTGLDCDPWHLGTLDGVVDLRTLEVLPAGKNCMVTRSIPFHWTPDAKSEQFEEFLAVILCYKPDLVKLMRAWLGYLLVGHNQDQKFTVWYGERGRNGKTTLWNVVSHILGDDYSGILDKRLILETVNPAQFALANIEGKRTCFAAEPKANSRLNVEWIKEFSGGEKMTAERKGIQGYDFRPVAKLILALNRLPMAQFDAPLMDRMIAVPFEQSFYSPMDHGYREGDLPRDPDLENKLKADVQGIIGVLAQCCLEYQRDGLVQPAESFRLAADFEAENDLVGQWILERCEVGKLEPVRVSTLYSSYTDFCEKAGVRNPGGKNLFSRRLDQEPGLSKSKPHNVPHFGGIRVVPDVYAPPVWAGLEGD